MSDSYEPHSSPKPTAAADSLLAAAPCPGPALRETPSSYGLGTTRARRFGRCASQGAHARKRNGLAGNNAGHRPHRPRRPFIPTDELPSEYFVWGVSLIMRARRFPWRKVFPMPLSRDSTSVPLFCELLSIVKRRREGKSLLAVLDGETQRSRLSLCQCEHHRL